MSCHLNRGPPPPPSDANTIEDEDSAADLVLTNSHQQEWLTQFMQTLQKDDGFAAPHTSCLHLSIYYSVH